MAPSPNTESNLNRSQTGNFSSQSTVAPLATVNTSKAILSGYNLVSGVYDINSRVLLTNGTEFGGNNKVFNSQGHSDSYPARGFWSTSRSNVNTNSISDISSQHTMRPPTKPKVIGLDSNTVLPPEKQTTRSRAIKGFYPSPRKRSGVASESDNSSQKRSPQSKAWANKRASFDSQRQRSASLRLESSQDNASVLGQQSVDCRSYSEQHSVHIPSHNSSANDHGHRAQSRISSLSPASTHAHGHRHASSQLPVTTAKIGTFSGYALEPDAPPAGKDTVSYLSNKSMMGTRQNAWVYRYKVKRNMNELSKILASKPPPDGQAYGIPVHGPRT